MTSSNTLKKIISIGAAALLAISGSLTATTPASAAEVTSVTLGGGSGLQASMQSMSLGATGCNSYSGTINLADWQLTLSSGTQTITSVSLFGYMVVNLSAPLTSGQTVTVTYTKNVSRIITCNNGDTVGSFTYMSVVSGGGGGMPAPGGTVVSNPSIAYNAGVLTSTAATWNNASVNKRSYWLVCSSSHDAMNGDLNSNNSRPTDCGPISATALSGQAPTWLNTVPYTIPASVNKWVSCSVNNCTTSVVSTTGAFFTWYEFDNGVWTQSATIGADGSSSSSSASVAEVVAPIPAIVAPLLPALAALSRPMVSLGGQVALSSGDFSGLTSAKIEGKTIDFVLGKTGNLTFTVPNGEAGKTADLLLTFTTGTVNLQNAIKYVAPVVVADVPERPVSIVPGSKKLSEATADQVRAAAFANMSNTAVSCVAYATSNTAAAKAAAIASANAVCALATKANPNLAAAPITVVVDKVKARKVGVGIKVYKATK